MNGMLDKIERSHRSEMIRQNLVQADVVLPDFRNLGVMLRVLLLAEWVRFVHAFSSLNDVSDIVLLPLQEGVIFDPALLTLLLTLMVLSPMRTRLPYYSGCFIVSLLAVLSAVGWRYLYTTHFQGPETVPDLFHVVFISLVLSALILFYFNWRHRVLSPALTEARLMALQSRIRPHFLFNSLNTVLGLMRAEPRRAETVLENLSELFRALMAETGMLVPLSRELELARSYAEIEAERLGERLTVNWQCQNAPLDALVPPMILQPLLENAVYHGIEPAAGGGTVSVTIFAKGDQLNLVMRNPCQPGQEKHSGNRMALNNIRERLDLHFDAEATMRAYEAGGEFVVQIRMPYRRAGK
jgi:two-component system sensor histidine kinase AlgZ